jgi:hypothetical protein
MGEVNPPPTVQWNNRNHLHTIGRAQTMQRRVTEIARLYAELATAMKPAAIGKRLIKPNAALRRPLGGGPDRRWEDRLPVEDGRTKGDASVNILNARATVSSPLPVPRQLPVFRAPFAC